MQLSVFDAASALGATDALAVPLIDGDEHRNLAAFPQLQLAIERGEARASARSLAVLHEGTQRLIAYGLGPAGKVDAEHLRAAAARVQQRALEIGCRSLCMLLPPGQAGVAAESAVSALTEGVLLANYRFDRYKSAADEEAGAVRQLEHLAIALPSEVQPAGVEGAMRAASLVAEAANEARDLQNRPANDLTPRALAAHAAALAEQIPSLSAESEGRAGLLERSMGAFAAVAQGSDQEPALITMRYRPPQGAASGSPVLGLVGKAITFDSGGISLKPGAKMAEMKFDMSGGAAVIAAIGAIARLQLPIEVLAVVGATENLPSGRAVKPGDIVTAANGRTIEVNNTDAEGRLVLADCLCHAAAQGAECLVDLATLTGAVLVALGSTHAGLIANDDALAERVAQAGSRSGEIVWRLPLHAEYDELIKGRYADIDNAPEGRKAGTIVAATFLSRFTSGLPWAHLDIAGSAWDLGRAYAPKGGAGYGVRLLVELARSYAA